MKKTTVFLAIISSILLFTATLLHAAEQKIIFNTERIKYESGTAAKICQDKCSRRSGPDAKSLLSEGWKILSSSPKEVIAETYKYTPCNNCQPHGCICIGTEYILQRDAPAPKVESSNNEPVAPDIKMQTGVQAPKTGTSNKEEHEALDKNTQTGLHTPKVETSNNELDLLKKENELLKQEITSLKQENETLKNQIQSIQIKKQ
jgi:hypothetical protein